MQIGMIANIVSHCMYCEKEEASCLAGVEVDVHNHDGEVGEHKSLRTEPQPGDEWDYFGRIMVIIYLNLESRMCMNTNMKKSKSGHMSTRSALSDCLFEIFLYFWTSDLQYFLESDLYFIQNCIFWFVTNRFKIWSLCDISCHIALECLFNKHMAHLHYSFKIGHEMLSLTWPPDDTTCASSKVGHLMAPLALVTKLSTRWRHLHRFQIWPPDGANCISCKFAHQMAPQRTRFVLTES